MKLTHLITMAGRGSRFQKAGYEKPKFLIPAAGRTLLEWSLSSLPLQKNDRVIVVALEEHEREHQISEHFRRFLPEISDIHFRWIAGVTDGQATTASLAADFFVENSPLSIANIDTAFSAPTLRRDLESAAADGWLGSFYSHDPKYSFARTDENGFVTEVQEKVAISSHALSGLYTFRSGQDFLDAYQEARGIDLRVKGEFYIAPMYNLLLKKGQKFRLNKAEWCHPLGTPEEVEAFVALRKSQA